MNKTSTHSTGSTNSLQASSGQAKPTVKELRHFGLVLGSCFAALGMIFFLLNKQRYVYFAETGIIFFLLSLFVPAWLAPVRRVWLAFGEALGFVVTRIILSVLFYLVVTPIGLLGRILGKKFLNMNFPSSRESFWDTTKKNASVSKESSERQF